TGAQVCELVLEDGVELRGIEQFDQAIGDDHLWLVAIDAVGNHRARGELNVLNASDDAMPTKARFDTSLFRTRLSTNPATPRQYRQEHHQCARRPSELEPPRGEFSEQAPARGGERRVSDRTQQGREREQREAELDHER